MAVCFEVPDWNERSRSRPVWAGFMVPREDLPKRGRVPIEYSFEGWDEAKRERWEWHVDDPGVLVAMTNIPVVVDEILDGVEERRTATFRFAGERGEIEFEPKAPLALAEFRYRCRAAFRRR